MKLEFKFENLKQQQQQKLVFSYLVHLNFLKTSLVYKKFGVPFNKILGKLVINYIK